MFNTKIIKKCIISLLLTAGVLTVMPLFSESTSIKYAGDFDIVQALNNNDLSIYKIIDNSDYTAESKQEFARKLISYSGAELKPDKNLFARQAEEEILIIRNDSEKSLASLEIDFSKNNISLSRGFTSYLNKNEDTPNLIAKSNAKEMAEFHLKNLDLFPNISEIGVSHVSEIRMSVAEKNGKTADYGKFVNIRFDRTLNGLPVQGNSRIVIRLAEKGSLHSMIYKWAPVKKENVSLKPELINKGNIEIMTQVTSRLQNMGKNAKAITVDSMELVLFDDGESYIEPAVYVKASLTYSDLQEIVPVDFYVPVISNSKAKFPSENSQSHTTVMDTEK